MSKKDVETSNKDIAKKVVSRKALYFVPDHGEVELDLIGETKQEEEVGDANK